MKFGEIIEQKEKVEHPDSTMRNPRGRVVTVPGRMVADLLKRGFFFCDMEGNPLPLKPALNAVAKESEPEPQEPPVESSKVKKSGK